MGKNNTIKNNTIIRNHIQVHNTYLISDDNSTNDTILVNTTTTNITQYHLINNSNMTGLNKTKKKLNKVKKQLFIDEFFHLLPKPIVRNKSVVKDTDPFPESIDHNVIIEIPIEEDHFHDNLHPSLDENHIIYDRIKTADSSTLPHRINQFSKMNNSLNISFNNVGQEENSLNQNLIYQTMRKSLENPTNKVNNENTLKIEEKKKNSIVINENSNDIKYVMKINENPILELTNYLL